MWCQKLAYGSYEGSLLGIEPPTFYFNQHEWIQHFYRATLQLVKSVLATYCNAASSCDAGAQSNIGIVYFQLLITHSPLNHVPATSP